MTKKQDIASVICLTVVGVCVIAALARCGPPQEVAAPNPNVADCLTDRGIEQRKCVLKFKTDPEIAKCIEDIRRSKDCTTDAGVAAFITSRDGSSP